MKDYSVAFFKDQIAEIDFLSLAMVKKTLRINSDDDDELLRNMIYAVCDRAENILGLNIRQRLVTQKFVGNNTLLKLKYCPVLMFKQISLITTQGIRKVLRANNYILSEDGKTLRILTKNIAFREVTVIYNTGYDSNTIPAMIKQGLLCHLIALYEGSEDHYVIPFKALDFYNSYKHYRL